MRLVDGYALMDDHISKTVDKSDEGKPRLTLVPRQIIWDICKAREYGLKKYPTTGKDGWKNVGVERYRDALMRHVLRYLDDPYGVDDESGLPHLCHVAVNVAFLCELEQGREQRK